MSMEIIGVKRSDFTTNDGKHICGYNLFITEERPDVVGLSCFSCFQSDEKLRGTVPAVGDQVRVSWSRFQRGKVDYVEFL